MAKELTHRGEELKNLGWSIEDVNRYIDLWDYRQRWGAINLEREDRQFLRKAENALPVITKGKASLKKPLEEKSYFKWLSFYYEKMLFLEGDSDLALGTRGVWSIILEEELRLISYYQPVLGLPDTLKAKLLMPLREQLIENFFSKIEEKPQSLIFDFNALIEEQKQKVKESKNWKSLRDEKTLLDKTYPIVSKKDVPEFRKISRGKLLSFIQEKFPSLADTEKPSPPDDWSQN